MATLNEIVDAVEKLRALGALQATVSAGGSSITVLFTTAAPASEQAPAQRGVPEEEDVWYAAGGGWK